VAVAGSKEAVARARAAVADRLTKTQAYLTASEEAQEIEDALRALRDPDDREAALATLRAVDDRLKRLTVPYEEWEVLYRQRLQVERDLLRRGTVEPNGKPGILSLVVEKLEGIIG
jgi:hypothetical protein